jgi:hypothetical protein
MTEEQTKPKLQIVPQDDLGDMERLWVNPLHGDGITSPGLLNIPVGKPGRYEFIRAHPDEGYRRCAVVVPVKDREGFEETFYLVQQDLAAKLELDGKPYILCTVIDRLGNLRIWPVRLPAEGEKDNKWWESARLAVRRAIDIWLRVIPGRAGYATIDAEPGYAPEPDWSKVKPFNELIKIAFGEVGIIKSMDHPVVRELFGKSQRGQ